MNKEDIIRMAREAGISESHAKGMQGFLERFAHLVYESVFRDANIAASRTILDAAVLEEREACAKVVEKFPYDCLGCLDDCAAAIRARSNP